jgi:hypothetical protein
VITGNGSNSLNGVADLVAGEEKAEMEVEMEMGNRSE